MGLVLPQSRCQQRGGHGRPLSSRPAQQRPALKSHPPAAVHFPPVKSRAPAPARPSRPLEPPPPGPVVASPAGAATAAGWPERWTCRYMQIYGEICVSNFSDLECSFAGHNGRFGAFSLSLSLSLFSRLWQLLFNSSIETATRPTTSPSTKKKIQKWNSYFFSFCSFSPFFDSLLSSDVSIMILLNVYLYYNIGESYFFLLLLLRLHLRLQWNRRVRHSVQSATL